MSLSRKASETSNRKSLTHKPLLLSSSHILHNHTLRFAKGPPVSKTAHQHQLLITYAAKLCPNPARTSKPQHLAPPEALFLPLPNRFRSTLFERAAMASHLFSQEVSTHNANEARPDPATMATDPHQTASDLFYGKPFLVPLDSPMYGALDSELLGLPCYGYGCGYDMSTPQNHMTIYRYGH